MFERLREAAEKQYTNIRLAQPYQHSIFNQEYLLSPDLFHRDEQLEVHRLLNTAPAHVLPPPPPLLCRGSCAHSRARVCFQQELKVLKPDDLRAFFPQVFSQIYVGE